MPVCFHCNTESDVAHYERVVNNRTALHGPWSGWRMAGRYLVAPMAGGRITPEQLGAHLAMQAQRAKLAAATRPGASTPLRIDPRHQPARKTASLPNCC